VRILLEKAEALSPGVMYIFISHSQSEHDKRVYIQKAEHLNVRKHRDITGEMWFGVGVW